MVTVNIGLERRAYRCTRTSEPCGPDCKHRKLWVGKNVVGVRLSTRGVTVHEAVRQYVTEHHPDWSMRGYALIKGKGRQE